MNQLNQIKIAGSAGYFTLFFDIALMAEGF